MKIDFDAKLHNLDGTPLTEGEGQDATPVGLGAVCVRACLVAHQSDASHPKLGAQLFGLAVRINKGGMIDLDAADVETVKGRIERAFGPIVVGQAWNLLEGREPFATA